MNAEKCRVVVLASGTGSNFGAIALACQQQKIPARVVCLVTDNPKAPAIELARSFDVESLVIEPPSKKAGLPEETENAIVEACRTRGADLIVLAGFMRILKGPLLEAFEGRIMNIHPSLLPSFKGLDGVRQALEYGVKITGCTVHFVERDVDGGAIIQQAAVTVEESDTEDAVLEKVHKEEHRIYVRAVGLFAENRLQRDGRRVRIVGESSPNNK